MFRYLGFGELRTERKPLRCPTPLLHQPNGANSTRSAKMGNPKPTWRTAWGATARQSRVNCAVIGPPTATMRISHEAIYRTLYLDKRWHHLIKYLPQARPKRRKRGQGKASRGPGIPNRVGIEQRPAIVEERSRLATGKAVPSSARDSKAISLPSSIAPHVCSRAATWTRNMRTWSTKPSSTRSKRCPFPG